MKEKVNFIVATVFFGENLSPLNSRINFNIFNCLQQVL